MTLLHPAIAAFYQLLLLLPQALSLPVLDDLYIGSMQSFEGMAQQQQGVFPRNMNNMSGMQQGGYRMHSMFNKFRI